MTIARDEPIERDEDDTLGRSIAAKSFAEQVLAFDLSTGLVVGVLGPWGSGKTSFLNLATRYMAERDVAVLAFNPWMFSGADQLVTSFFIELSAQLKIRPGLKAVGKDLEYYGEAFSGLGWLPFVGSWIERARGVNRLAAQLMKRRRKGIAGTRDTIRRALRELKSPIVVVVDDIDRLTTDEIRDVFKLVRLTASFPNIVYVLAFDRRRVEDALKDQGIPGRDYLEKILQLAVDLPAVPDGVLASQVLRGVNDALTDIDDLDPISLELWPDVFAEVVRPLVRNMRDVRRYSAALHGTVRDLAGQIELIDVLGLEAIRVFLPDVFSGLHASVDSLTSTRSSFGSGAQDPAARAQIDLLISSAGDDAAIVQAMIRRLFPAAQRHVGGSSYGSDWQRSWLRARRVAHADLLRLYLERVAGDGLIAFGYTERAWALADDLEGLTEFFNRLEPHQLQDVISGLESYEDEYQSDHVVPCCVAVLNALSRTPDRERGMLDLDKRLVVGRVSYRLLRCLADHEAVEGAAREILLRLSALSSQQILIDDLGYREGRGHQLATEAAAAAFEREWRDRVRAATVEQLVADDDLLRVLLLAKRESEVGEPPVELEASAELTLAVLRAAVSHTRSQSVESRHVRRSARLSWAALVEVCESEEALRERVEHLRVSRSDVDLDLLALFDKYANGWRPSEFGDDD